MDVYSILSTLRLNVPFVLGIFSHCQNRSGCFYINKHDPAVGPFGDEGPSGLPEKLDKARKQRYPVGRLPTGRGSPGWPAKIDILGLYAKGKSRAKSKT
jgi:hypothetical protein